MVPQTTDFRCERTRRKQYAPPRRGIKIQGGSDKLPLDRSHHRNTHSLHRGQTLWRDTVVRAVLCCPNGQRAGTRRLNARNYDSLTIIVCGCIKLRVTRTTERDRYFPNIFSIYRRRKVLILTNGWWHWCSEILSKRRLPVTVSWPAFDRYNTIVHRRLHSTNRVFSDFDFCWILASIPKILKSKIFTKSII